MKTKYVTTTVLALFLGCMLLAPVSAQPRKPLRCELWMQAYMTTPPHWEGKVKGDIVGSIIVTEGAPRFPGATEHFAETFVITTDGGTIEGSDDGVWSFKTFKWRANGVVTDATGDWAYLIGCKVHEIGMTTPYPPPDGETLIGWGTITIVCG